MRCVCTELMKILVEYGADVNSINKDGENALMTSVESGNTDCLQYLLSQGADPNHRDVIGVAPIHIVCKRGKPAQLKQPTQLWP